MEEKAKCTKCGAEKPLTVDHFQFRKDEQRFRKTCKDCKNTASRNKLVNMSDEEKENYKKYHREYNHEWTKDNKEKLKLASDKYRNSEKFVVWKKQYMEDNKEYIIAQKKEYRSKDPEHWKNYQATYYANNKERIKERDEARKEERKKVRRDYMRRKRQSPRMKIYSSVSRQVHIMITSQKSSKANRTFLKYVNWTLEELRAYLESLFEPWMTWDNYGKYNASAWDDQDIKTWTWQIDHIIPQSNLPYDSLEHENFNRCWALENLRPLSAKQNVLDGANRIRH